jgi:hypothetical protein
MEPIFNDANLKGGSGARIHGLQGTAIAENLISSGEAIGSEAAQDVSLALSHAPDPVSRGKIAIHQDQHPRLNGTQQGGRKSLLALTTGSGNRINNGVSSHFCQVQTAHLWKRAAICRR